MYRARWVVGTKATLSFSSAKNSYATDEHCSLSEPWEVSSHNSLWSTHVDTAFGRQSVGTLFSECMAGRLCPGQNAVSRESAESALKDLFPKAVPQDTDRRCGSFGGNC